MGKITFKDVLKVLVLLVIPFIEFTWVWPFLSNIESDFAVFAAGATVLLTLQLEYTCFNKFYPKYLLGEEDEKN